MAAVTISKIPMNKLFSFAAAALLLTGGLSSCDPNNRNADYPFTIIVKTSTPDDTVVVPNVLVEINVPIPSANPEIYTFGYTNEAGEVSFEYGESAILAVRASRGTRPRYTWMGCTDVRLLPNEEVVKTVYLEPYDSLLIGCQF